MRLKRFLPALAVLAFFAAQRSIGQATDATLESKASIRSLLAPIPACELLELSSDGALAQLGNKEQVLKVHWLEVVSSAISEGIPRPRAKTERAQYHREIDPINEKYFTSWPKNDLFRSQIDELTNILRANPHLEMKIGDFTNEADRRIREAKSNGQIGECYRISQVTGTLNTEWIQIVSLSPEIQNSIDLFLLEKFNSLRSANTKPSSSFLDN